MRVSVSVGSAESEVGLTVCSSQEENDDWEGTLRRTVSGADTLSMQLLYQRQELLRLKDNDAALHYGKHWLLIICDILSDADWNTKNGIVHSVTEFLSYWYSDT